MTTIVYDHYSGQIAYESRETCDNLIISDDCEKATRRGDTVYIGAGDSDDIDELIDNFSSEAVSDESIAAEVFFIEHGKAWRGGQLAGQKPWKVKMDSNRCCGTGGLFALAALDFGRSAVEAVEYAKTKDIYSGGKVRVIKVK